MSKLELLILCTIHNEIHLLAAYEVNMYRGHVMISVVGYLCVLYGRSLDDRCRVCVYISYGWSRVD